MGKLFFNKGLISGLILFELGDCFCKRLFYAFLFSLGSRISHGKASAIVNPENKPTKVNWALSWPSSLEICGRAVL